jgi:anti-sigma B factor antagonist
MPFGLELGRHGNSTVLRLTGELDIETSPEVKDSLDRLVEQGHVTIVADLGGLTFCDSTGISALVHGYHRCQHAGGYLRIQGETGTVARVLELAGLRQILRSSEFVIDNTPAEAR